MSRTQRTLDDVLAEVTQWAATRPDVEGLALVGSHARGAARPDSDVDVVLLIEDPSRLLADPGWTYPTVKGQISRP